MTRKKIISLISAGVLLVAAAVAAVVIIIDKNSFDPNDLEYVCDNGAVMSLTSVNSETYIFVPSFAQSETVTVRLKATYDGLPVTVNGRKMEAGESVKASPDSEGKLLFESGGNGLYVTVKASSGMPSLFIETDSGTMAKVDADKEYKEAGEMELRDAEGNSLTAELKYITGRGNQTWRYGKKPYNIKLEDAEDILGMGEAEEWSLIANYLDVSGMRNYLVYGFAQELGFAYTPQCKYVDLWLNGSYAGQYLIMEKVEISPERIDIYNLEEMTEILNGDLSRFEMIETEFYRCYNIKNNPGNITEGYVIEYENEERYNSEASWFKLRDGTTFTVKSPKYVSAEQMAFLRAYVQSAVDAMDAEDGIDPATGKHYSELIDTESFAKKYIVEEFSGNKDSEWSSQYYYISQGKMYAGPVWDYDHTFGNGGFPCENPETIITPWRSIYKEFPGWYSRLLRHEEFFDLVCEIYENEARPIITRMLEDFDALRLSIYDSSVLNELKWYGVREYTPDADKDYLKDYVEKRAAFLDRLWIDREELVYVYFVGIGVEHYYSVMVEPGTTLAEISDTGLGISIEEADIAKVGGGLADIYAPITEDCGFYVTLETDVQQSIAEVWDGSL